MLPACIRSRSMSRELSPVARSLRTSPLRFVNEINARHARERVAVTKASALELLSRNSREAAAAEREFTDEELDRAAPFSLSFGAPVTAQFVVEDHACLLY